MSRSVTIIGIDAAVDPRNNALSVATYYEGDAVTLDLHDVVRPSGETDLYKTLSEWIGEAVAASQSVALCVDSPLGWPHRFAPSLAGHRAGEPVGMNAGDDAAPPVTTTISDRRSPPNTVDAFFRRVTDLDIARRLKKTPLDVAADRIARTTYRTLQRIDEILRRVSSSTGVNRFLPLRRDALRRTGSDTANPTVAILETYPAGWFASEGIDTRGYRKSAAIEQRVELLWSLPAAATRRYAEHSYTIHGFDSGAESRFTELVSRGADELDAIVCLCAGTDALLGRAPSAFDDADVMPGATEDVLGNNAAPRDDAPGFPGDATVVHDDGTSGLVDIIAREGWIWCKSPR